MINKIKLRIDGLNLNRIINELILNGICLDDLIIKSNYITFYVQNNNLSKIDFICKKYHKNYKIIQNNAFFRFVKILPNCIGIILALIISTVFCFSYNLYVFKVTQLVLMCSLD